MSEESTETSQPVHGSPSPNSSDAAPVDTSQPAPLRENMISTAINFLQNPQVQSSPLSQRRAFLKKKGLTDDEIKSAMERSGVKEPIPPSPPQQGQQLMQAPGQHQVPDVPALPPRSMYARTRDFAAIAIIVSGVTYGLYKLFKKFILPFFKKQGESDKKLDNIETSIAQVNNTLTATVTEIQKSVSQMQTLMEKQEAQLEQISRDLLANKAIAAGRGEPDIMQIKQEITSLKGLMLNRHQFPSTPQQSSIPDWQKKSSTPSKELQYNETPENEDSGNEKEDESFKAASSNQLNGGVGGVLEEGANGVSDIPGVNGVLDTPTRGTEVNLLKKSMLENDVNVEAGSNEQTTEIMQNQTKEEAD